MTMTGQIGASAHAVPEEASSYIDGERRSARGAAADVMDPSQGATVATARLASIEDVDAAVGAAVRAQVPWAQRTFDDRVGHLLRLADLIESRAEHIAWVESVNTGMTLDGARGDVSDAVRALRSWPALAERASARGEGTSGHIVQRAPCGVVARLTAFNHPFLFAVKGTAALLLAGNAVVVKPADPTPLSAMLLADIVSEALPGGVLNVIVGDRSAGDALVRHPDVRRIAFTGSTRTGQAIQRAAAEVSVKSVTLELGGKNAMIVCPDAPLPGIGDAVVSAMSMTSVQGQSCGSMSRVLAHRDVYDEVVARIGDAFAALRVGVAYQDGVDVGPMVTAEHRDRVRAHIGAGIEHGARAVTGGEGDDRVPSRGFFVAPTVFADVARDNPIAREEIFGPVVSVLPWDDEDDAVALANSTEYGLTASVWSEDDERALRIASRMEAGYVWLNHSAVHHFGQPFGGWKNSGLGREECEEEYLSYFQSRVVHLPRR